mmetsp:Transcript_28627/g.43996  ORF Transcript_28627/g.43996 Transcript_28627/m.43996 type:complete len:451 (+) Transcript_28627:30-1382(+)
MNNSGMQENSPEAAGNSQSILGKVANADALKGFKSTEDAFGMKALENVRSANSDSSSQNKPLIRLQDPEHLDPAVTDFKTEQEVWNKIEEVKKEQGQAGVSSLYPRKWKRILPKNESSDETQHTFSVLQFNVLAEGLSSGPTVTTPFQIDTGDQTDSRGGNNYGGFVGTKNPELVLDFVHRRWRILEVLLTTHDENNNPGEGGCRERYNIMAVEEMDRYYGFFMPILKLFGYNGLFIPKERAPGTKLGWYSDGCGLFWSDKMFELVSEEKRGFNVGNQVFLIVVLRHRVSDKLIIVAVTHLKAQDNEANEQIRIAQVTELLQHIDTVSNSIGSTFEDIPVLIMGDFNSAPSLVDDKPSTVGCILDRNEGNKYDSSYSLNDEGFYTTWKTRGDKTTQRVIDYIFFNGPRCNSLECMNILDVPSVEDVAPDVLPNLRYPSDHVMIAAKFKLS